MSKLERLMAEATAKGLEVLLRTDTAGFFMHVYVRDSLVVDSRYKVYSRSLDLLLDSALDAVSRP
jgi:hypothetical protein